jgi:hypothetical protein
MKGRPKAAIRLTKLHQLSQRRGTGALTVRLSAPVMLCMSLPMARCPLIQSPMGRPSIARTQVGTGR